LDEETAVDRRLSEIAVEKVNPLAAGA